MSDIVEHLKECAKYAEEYPSDVYAFKAAATEITRLREENARLREERDLLQAILTNVSLSMEAFDASAAIREEGKEG